MLFINIKCKIVNINYFMIKVIVYLDSRVSRPRLKYVNFI